MRRWTGWPARKQRERLEAIEEELADVRRRLGRLFHLIEATDSEVAGRDVAHQGAPGASGVSRSRR